jgi:hypothetical protein
MGRIEACVVNNPHCHRLDEDEKRFVRRLVTIDDVAAKGISLR